MGTSVDSTLPPRLITDASAVANKARRLGRKKSREGRRLPYCPQSSTPAHSPRSRAPAKPIIEHCQPPIQASRAQAHSISAYYPFLASYPTQLHLDRSNTASSSPVP